MEGKIIRVVTLYPSQRRKRARLINDIYPGIIIVVAGISMLGSGQFTLLAIANIIAGAALVRFGLKEWRSSAREEPHGIQWFDVFGGVVTILDALTIYKPWKGFQPAWLYFAVGLAAITKGVFNIKIPTFRHLTIFADGFKIRISPFSVFSSKWSDMQSLEFAESRINLTPKNSKTRLLKLHGIENATEAAEVLMEAARSNEVQVLTDDKLSIVAVRPGKHRFTQFFTMRRKLR